METHEKKEAKFFIKEALRLGWQKFKEQWTFLVPALIVTFLISIAISALNQSLDGVGQLFIAIAAWIIQILLGIGWIVIDINVAKGKLADWKNFAESAEVWWKVLLGSVLYVIFVYIGLILFIIPDVIFVYIGLILFIIPGVYFAVKYQFYPYLLVQNPGMGIWESFKESSRITKGSRWKLFGFQWVLLGVNILGILALGVGIIVSVLITGIAVASVYLALKEKSAPQAAEENESAESSGESEA